MKLGGKLAAFLGAILLAVLSTTVLLINGSLQSRVEAFQDATIQGDLEALAKHCAEAQGPRFEKICLEALYYKADASRPALYAAYLLDPKQRVVLHTDFLRGDFARRGAPISDSDIRRRAGGWAPFILRREDQRAFGVPVFAKDRQRLGTLVALYNDDQLQSSLLWIHQETRRQIAWACLFGSCLGVALSIWLAAYLLGPIRVFGAIAARVGRGDLTARVPEDRGDELGTLAVQFNRMIAGLAELDELKGSFIAKITHDLKTPLQAIAAQSDNLITGLKGPLNAEQTQDLELIVKNAQVLNDLIDHLLELTKIEAGRTELKVEALDLDSELGSAVSLLKPRAQEFGVELSYETASGLTSAFADASALRRILTNLIGNALKFTPKGGRVSLKATRRGPNEVLVAVSDTGIGIPKDRLDGLFKKFAQVPETRNKVREAGGSGLGLVISKELVESLGGRIWAESALFRGTTLYFTLPEKAPSPAPTP